MILERDRVIQRTNTGAYLVCLDKEWSRFNNLERGDRVKMLCGSSIIVVIAPGSPVYQGKGLEALKRELLTW